MGQYEIEKGRTSRKQSPCWLKGLDKFNLSPKSIFDWGQGRFPNIPRDILEKRDIKYSGFDPIHFPNKKKELGDSDTIVCGSVLNVIKDDRELRDVMNELISDTLIVGTALVTIYEGHKDKKTGPVQRNEKTGTYLEKFMSLTDKLSFKKKGNMILMTVS